MRLTVGDTHFFSAILLRWNNASKIPVRLSFLMSIVRSLRSLLLGKSHHEYELRSTDVDITGTSSGSEGTTVVDLQCSAICEDITAVGTDIEPPDGNATYICKNIASLSEVRMSYYNFSRADLCVSLTSIARHLEWTESPYWNNPNSFLTNNCVNSS